VRWVGR